MSSKAIARWFGGSCWWALPNSRQRNKRAGRKAVRKLRRSEDRRMIREQIEG